MSRNERYDILELEFCIRKVYWSYLSNTDQILFQSGYNFETDILVLTLFDF